MRTHGRHLDAPGCTEVAVEPFPFALSRNGASVVLATHRSAVWTDMDPLGFEPRASSLQRRHSTTELRALALVVLRCPTGGPTETNDEWGGPPRGRSAIGGDPAADSPTATLLRLKPPCEAQIRLPNGSLIRTSLGCFDGRCVQGAGTYSPRASDTRLLPNPAS